MLRYVSCCLLILLCQGCAPRYVDYFPYNDDGRAKPAVALLPMAISHEVQSSLSNGEWIDEKMRFEIMERGQVFLISEAEIEGGVAQVQGTDLFHQEARFPELFCNADFVVIPELIEFKVSPFNEPLIPCNYKIISYPCTGILGVKVHLKVVDLRPRSSRVVLDEIFTTGFVLPFRADAEIAAGSPLWRATQWLASELVDRLEQVTYCAY